MSHLYWSIDSMSDDKVGRIRIDYRTGSEIIFSPVRDNKPMDFHSKETDWSTDISKCPFEYEKAELNKTLMLIGGDEHSWKLRVIENKFPFISPYFNHDCQTGFFNEKSAFGYSEIILDTPKHNFPFDEFDDGELKMWIDVVVLREENLYANAGIKHVYVFKNEGPKSGASLSHTHTQIMAFPEPPETILKESARINANLSDGGKCLYEEAMQREKDRILAENSTFMAFAPFGSRFMGEALILPKRHINYAGKMSNEEKMDLANLLGKVLKTNVKLFGRTSYNMVFHEIKSDERFHFHIEIYPRVITFAGVEFAGFSTNQLYPEKYADMFKAAL